MYRLSPSLKRFETRFSASECFAASPEKKPLQTPNCVKQRQKQCFVVITRSDELGWERACKPAALMFSCWLQVALRCSSAFAALCGSRRSLALNPQTNTEAADTKLWREDGSSLICHHLQPAGSCSGEVITYCLHNNAEARRGPRPASPSCWCRRSQSG